MLLFQERGIMTGMPSKRRVQFQHPQRDEHGHGLPGGGASYEMGRTRNLTTLPPGWRMSSLNGK
jgi:hypothetical protein